MRLFSFILLAMLGLNISFAQETCYTEEEQELLMFLQADSISGRTGAVQLSSAHCTLNVPDGFVFLDPQESKHLLVDYWDNPEERLEGVLGTMVKADAGIYVNVETAYIVSYDNCGYVSDEDAASIDYSDLLKEIQEGLEEVLWSTNSPEDLEGI